MGCAYSQNVVDFRHQMRNSPRAFSEIRRTEARMNAAAAATGSRSRSRSQSQVPVQMGQTQGSTQSLGQNHHQASRNHLVVVQEHENYIRYLARNNARLLVPDLAGKPCGLPIVSRFAKAQTEPYAPKDLACRAGREMDSLVDLCLKVICKNRNMWVGESAGDLAQFSHFPENLYQELYRLLESHNLLTLKVLKSFRNCSIPSVDLSKYPLVNDLWMFELCAFRNLIHLNLTNCKNLTDHAFENALFGQTSCQMLSLDLTFCSKLTDASLSKLIPAFADTLEHLSLSNCVGISDLTLSRVLQCSRLVYLNLSKCRQLTKAYLCQLGLLTDLRHLDISLIPNVDDHVVQALQPRVGMDSIMEAIATSLGRKSVVAIRESVYAKRLGSRKAKNSHSANRSSEKASVGSSESQNQGSSANVRVSGAQSQSTNLGSASQFYLGQYPQEGSSSNAKQHTNPCSYSSAPRPKKSKVQPPDCGLSQLEVLNVSWTSVGDGACEALVRLDKLRSLDVSNCALSNLAFNRLFDGLRSLEELQARYCGTGKELDLTTITHLKKLRKINLDNVTIGKLFPASAKMPFLEELHISNTECMLPNLSEICPRLKVLKAEGLSMSSKSMREVSKLEGLEELNLCDCMLNEYDFINLKWLTNLVVLDVSHSRVSDFCVKIISSGVINLEELHMDSVLLTNHALRHLKNLKRLRKLDLFESLEISDEGLFHLSCMPSIEELEVCGGKVRDCGVKYLCGLPKLSSLNLSKNSLMTDKSIGYIADNLAESLKSLNLSRTGVTPIGLCQLTAMQKLEQLTARGLKVNKSIDSSIIAKLLSEVPTLWYVLT